MRKLIVNSRVLALVLANYVLTRPRQDTVLVKSNRDVLSFDGYEVLCEIVEQTNEDILECDFPKRKIQKLFGVVSTIEEQPITLVFEPDYFITIHSISF